MKKSSKVLSLVLAVLMAVSCFSGLTIFSASAEETNTKIYFDISTAPAEWGTTKNVYCHLYAVAGDEFPEHLGRHRLRSALKTRRQVFTTLIQQRSRMKTVRSTAVLRTMLTML